MGMVLGFVVTGTLMRLGLGYDIVARYRNAMAFHLQWKDEVILPSLERNLPSALLNLSAFALYLGLPLAVLVLAGAAAALRRVRELRSPTLLLPVVLLGTVLLLTVFGHAVGEVNRLWVFLVPCACVVAAAAWRDRLARQGWTFSALLALQGVTLLLTKHFLDFW